MRAAILIFWSVFSAIFGLDLPFYFPKCSLSDPDLNECLITSGNLVVPQLTKEGESNFDIPILSPLFVDELELPGPSFTAVLTNLRLEGLEGFKLREVNFSIESTNQWAKAEIPALKLAADYRIVTNALFARSVQVLGKAKIVLDQNVGFVDADIEQYEKDDDSYFKFLRLGFDLKTRRILYTFTDLYTANTGGLLQFLNLHKEIIDHRIKPAIERLLAKYTKVVLEGVVEKVPIKDIFEP